MPNSEMNTITYDARDFKRKNSINATTEKTTMLEVSQTIPKLKKRVLSKYKYHFIVSAIVIFIILLLILNLPPIRGFFRDMLLEKNLMRNFSETDPHTFNSF